MKFTFKLCDDFPIAKEKHREDITGSVEQEFLRNSIDINLDGYGVYGAAPGYGTPIILEVHNGKVRLIVWSDINSDEPTHIIDMEGAAEGKRVD